jgi:endogenous inhibitor of DNA gyrase (YacG/DUF329 family)
MNKTYHFRPCPHCGQLLRSGSMATHEPVCVKRPEIYARLRSVLASEDGKHGIARARYVELSKVDKSLPTLNTLIRRAQSPCWDGVLAFFKLSPPLPEACRSQCPRCGKLVAGGNMAAHQAECRPQERKPQRTPQPKSKPAPAEPAPVALVVAPVQEREISLPLPRIKPAAPASKWAGTLGYDPTWKAPTGDTQWLVMVHPGERTCLACGDTFAAGRYCIHCGEENAGSPSVATADYLRPAEYAVVR